MTHVLALALVAAVAVFSTPAAQAQDIQAGERNAAMCIGCHGIPGYQSSFPEVHRVPMISGQNAKYIVAALQAYKKGDRKHPTMRAIAQGLTDQEMADLAAFYEQQARVAPVPAKPATEPPAAVADLLKRANCASCHGENYSKAIDPSYPKLAGQHPDYLYVALKAYKTEGQAIVGRNNAIMAAIVKQYTPAELRLIANHLGSLPGELRTVSQSRFR
jgi:cytochrome c553